MVTQLHQIIDWIARLLEVHTALEETPWLGITEWMENRETKWDNSQKDNIVWGTGIADITTKILAEARVGTDARAQDTRMEERDKTVRQDGGCLEASQHAGAMQSGEAEKRHLQQQPKPKHKLQLKQQSVQQHEPNLNPALTLAGRWATVQPQKQSQQGPATPGPP